MVNQGECSFIKTRNHHVLLLSCSPSAEESNNTNMTYGLHAGSVARSQAAASEDANTNEPQSNSSLPAAAAPAHRPDYYNLTWVGHQSPDISHCSYYSLSHTNTHTDTTTGIFQRITAALAPTLSCHLLPASVRDQHDSPLNIWFHSLWGKMSVIIKIFTLTALQAPLRFALLCWGSPGV